MGKKIDLDALTIDELKKECIEADMAAMKAKEKNQELKLEIIKLNEIIGEKIETRCPDCGHKFSIPNE